jgi:hypothetical protein
MNCVSTPSKDNKFFYFLHSVLPGSGVHRTSYLICNGGSLPGILDTLLSFVRPPPTGDFLISYVLMQAVASQNGDFFSEADRHRTWNMMGDSLFLPVFIMPTSV